MNNFKVKCIADNGSIYFDKDKIYEVRDGNIYTENQIRIDITGFANIAELNSKSDAAFVLVKEEFTQDDLQTGMLVKTRCGNVNIVIKDNIVGDYIVSKSLSTSFLKDMKNFAHGTSGEHDIIAVYKPASLWHLQNFDLEEAELLWEESASIEMTIKEIEDKLGIRNLRIKTE